MGASETRNDFTQGSVFKNIIKMAIPLTVALLVSVLYSLVDRIYIGHIRGVGTAALSGIGYASPVISIVNAFQALISTGGSPLCSIARGEGDHRKAAAFQGNAYVLLVSLGLVLTVLGEIFSPWLIRKTGGSGEALGYALAYLRIYLLGTVFLLTGTGMNPFINSQGFAKIGMLTVMIGAVSNIILDPLFIFVFGWGVRGAAAATVIAQFLASAWVFRFLTGKRAILRLTRDSMKLQPDLIKRMLSLGITGFVMQFTNGAVTMVYNTQLSALGGQLYITSMTIISSVREFVFMPISGFSEGAKPVIGFNYGAGRYDRVRECIKVITLTLFAVSIVIYGFIQLEPELIIGIFNDDPELMTVGVHCLRLFYAVYFMQTFQMCGQTIFTSLGMVRYAITFSLLRKVAVVIPMALILPHFFGIDGVFLSEPVSECTGALACFITMILTVLPMLKQKELERAAQL